MEKFGQWSDKKTGVRPFILAKLKLPQWKVCLRLIVGGVKLCCAAIAVLFGGIVNPFLAQWLPIRFLSRFFTRLTHFCYFNGLLALLGHYFTRCVPRPLVQKIVDSEKWKTPKRGTIVFAPLTNFVNLLYMTARFSPVYAVPSESNGFVTYDVIRLIWRLWHSENLRDGATKSLATVLEEANGPVVILAEGALTNGLGLLKFVPFEADLPQGTEVQVLGFVHEDGSVNFVCGSWFGYVVKLLGRFYASFSVVTTMEADLPQPQGKITAEYLEKVRSVLGRLLHIPLLELGADDFLAYVESFRKLGKVHTD
jgi:hypothetical protein